MTATVVSDLTLMALWSRHKAVCRPIGNIIADARAGKLPGIEPLATGFGYRVVDEKAALSSMQTSAQ